MAKYGTNTDVPFTIGLYSATDGSTAPTLVAEYDTLRAMDLSHSVMSHIEHIETVTSATAFYYIGFKHVASGDNFKYMLKVR